MKHRLGVSVGVVLLGIGVGPFWMGKPGKASHPVNESSAVRSCSAPSLLVASVPDDYLPPLLGYTDDELIDNPRLNPVLALTGAQDDDEPGRLTFLAEYLPRLPVAPSLLLMGGYDAPRLTPFPNPGFPTQGLNLFGGNGIDATAGAPFDNSNPAVNNQARTDLGYAPATPPSINPTAPLTYPRLAPGFAQPMPNPPGPSQGAAVPPAGQAPPTAFPNQPASPPAGYAAPSYGAPGQYPPGHPEMLAYGGAPVQAPPFGAYPFAGYALRPGYGYGSPPGFGYGPNGAPCGQGSPFYGANPGGYSQYPGMMAGGHAGHGMGPGFDGFPGGVSPASYNMGAFGYESGFGSCCPPSLGCCPPSPGCCRPVSCCGPEMGACSMSCCPPMNCCPPMDNCGGCCSKRRGLFGKLKDWFRGGSCCNDYDGCCEQPRGGLFCRLKNCFHKKKGCCYPAPVYCCEDPCGGCNGGFAGGYQGGFGY